MTTFTGSEGTIEVSQNHTDLTSPKDAIFINTNRTKSYGAEYVTVSPDTARSIITAIQAEIDKFEALKPPKAPTRRETIKAYNRGTVFTVGSYRPEKFVRLNDNDVFNVESGRVVNIDSWFADTFGTKDLKVVLSA